MLGHLKKGPRLKSDATKDLEAIVKLFLNPTQKAQCRFNALGELEVVFNDQIFNLTQILMHQPDFEHFSFSDEVSEHYEMFIETASHKPSLEGGVFIPRQEDYEKADKNKRYTQLTYGEKLAITLYTSNFYEEINSFLRTQGRDISFKELSSDRLTEIVKEIVLASCLAAHGLTRLELPNDSDDSSLQEVYRAESSHRIPESVWKQRHKAIDTHIPIRQDGFISSSEDMNAMKLSGTDTTLKISQPHHGIGKRVQDLSYKGDEQEVLLVPGTQLAFGSFSQDKGRKVFEAFVVRSLDGIDPSSYSTVNAEIRTQLISLREQVDYLRGQVPPPQKTPFSLWKSLSNSIKKTEIVALQDQIKQLDKLILWFEDNKHKTSEKIAKLEALNKKMGKLVEKVRGSNLLHEPLKDASTKISHLIMQLKIGNSSGLIREAGYVYTHHLSKAYKETELESTDAVLARDNQVIHRPNHGLAHSLRVATYIPLVVEYFQQFAKPKLSQLCQNLNSEELKKLQLCMLFSVSGRESDLAFKSNPEKYREYRQRCAEQFTLYARGKMSKDDVNKYAELILNMGNPDYLKSKNITPKKQALFHIMNLAHKLDLMRCYHLAQYNIAIANGHDSLIVPSDSQQRHFNALLKTVTQRIHATGDRVYCQVKDNQLMSSTEDYNFPVFARASTDARECLQFIAEADTPNLTSASSHSVESTILPSTADNQADNLQKTFIFLDSIENYTLALLKFLTAVKSTGIAEIDEVKKDGRYLLQKLIPKEEHYILLAETAYMDTKPISITLTNEDLYLLLLRMPQEMLEDCYSAEELVPLLNKSLGQLRISALDKVDSSYQITAVVQDEPSGPVRIKLVSSQMGLDPIEVSLSRSELFDCLQSLSQEEIFTLKFSN